MSKEVRKAPEPVYIEWCDAIASGLDWTDADVVYEWGKRSEWVVQEMGWILQETPEYIVIASVHKPEDEFCNEQYKQLMKIPKTWIKKRTSLDGLVGGVPGEQSKK